MTYRAIQGRFLFRPSPELNDIVLGVLGRAQRLHAVRVCGVTVLSNHLHLLLVVDDAKQLADFMGYLGSNIAREVNRLIGWSGPVFQGRYSMIVVTDEEEAQVERFRYLLAQGCKENLVARLRDWPGGSPRPCGESGGTPRLPRCLWRLRERVSGRRSEAPSR